MTALPAASAAATWPVKIASGKFQGLMQAKTPRPCSDSSFRSPVGPASVQGARELLARAHGVVAQEIDRLAQVGLRIVERLAGLADEQRHEPGAFAFIEIGGPLENPGARLAAPPVPGCDRPRLQPSSA